MIKLIDKLVAVIWEFFAVKRSSWHYKMVQGLTENGDLTTDPLDYWVTFGPVILLLWMIRKIFIIVMWVAGFSRDKRFRDNDWMPSLLPHRMTSQGKKKLFVPWEIIFMSFPAYMGMVIWFGIHPNIWVIMAVLSPLLLIRISSNPEPQPRLNQ